MTQSTQSNGRDLGILLASWLVGWLSGAVLYADNHPGFAAGLFTLIGVVIGKAMEISYREYCRRSLVRELAKAKKAGSSQS